MKIIILGSRGFIGSHLCDFFKERGNEITGCDIVTYGGSEYSYYQLSVLSSDLENIFSTHRFDICINASGAANVSSSVLYPLSDFEANVFAVMKVLDIIRRNQPSCKYVHISSAAVYGNPDHLPVSESAKLDPISPYGYHKLMSETICREYFTLFQIPLTIIRPFSIFGNGLKKQLMWDICSKLKQSDQVVLFGTGNETRDFIHISDFTLLTETIINGSSFNAEIFNAASGKQTTISEIAGIFAKHSGRSKKITFNGQSKKGDPVHWEADIEAVRKLGFAPRALLETSLEDYINWFNNEHEA